MVVIIQVFVLIYWQYTWIQELQFFLKEKLKIWVL